MDLLRLAKYEALGNDFLISFDQGAGDVLDARLIVALCDRHRGIGADGLIGLRPSDDGGLSMRLTNADGSPAETSGNGLRCVALAAFDAGAVKGGSVQIETVVGRRRADLVTGGDGAGEIRVEMGQVHVAATDSPLGGKRAFRADVGNPHLVLLGSRVDDVDLAVIGPELEAAWPGGQNVEVIAVSAADELDLVVFERGAGITEACGSGSVAAAAAARLQGVTRETVTVHNPGGDLGVELSGPDLGRPMAWLTGPARRIAELEVRLDDFDVTGRAGGALSRR